MTPEHKALVERLRAASDAELHGPDGEWASGAYPTIYDLAADAIEFLSSSPTAQTGEAITVKPLEWDERSGAHYADTAFGEACVDEDGDGFYVIESGRKHSGFASVDAAKTFVQNNHNIWVNDWLTHPAPAVSDAVELRRYIDRCRELANGGEYTWWSRLAEILATLHQEPAPEPAAWRDMASAPKDTRILAVVDDETRIAIWGKTSHVPIYGWCLADQGAEDFDLCEPTGWMPLPSATAPVASPLVGEGSEAETERKLATVVAPDNGTVDEVLRAVLECAQAWVPEARIIGNVRAGDIARAVSTAISAGIEPLDDSSMRARIGALGNELHNIATEHQNDEELATALGSIVSRLWELSALSAASIPTGGRVKALEWGKYRNGDADAVTPFGEIYTAYASGHWRVTKNGKAGKFIQAGNDVESAKAAAQSDYERRILSALISPSPVGGQDLPVAGERRAWVVALPSGEAMHETPTFSSKSAAVEWGKGFWGEDEWNHGYQAIQVALSHPAPERAVEALREFAQFVADYSNDPHVVKEAHKHLAASTGEANHG